MSSNAARKNDQPIARLLEQPEVIKIVMSALTETIQSYTQTKVVAGKPFIKAKGTPTDLAVLGLIRFESDDFSLELILGFSKTVFIALYENMFMMPPDDISPENHDLAGEILNIAFGAMDPKFREINFKLRSSFPKIYSGLAVKEILSKIDGAGVVIPYMTADKKPFVIELYTENSIDADWQYDPGVKTKDGKGT